MPTDSAPTWRAVLADVGADGRVVKGHGTGNDFVVVLDLDDRVDLPAGAIRALCDRHTGIGADGVIRITAAVPADVDDDIRAEVAGVPLFMDYRNGDGTIVEMCGNGVRVVADVVERHAPHLLDADRSLVVGTRAGRRPVVVGERSADPTAPIEVTVDMGPATLTTESIHLDDAHADGDAAAFRLVDPVVEQLALPDPDSDTPRRWRPTFAAASMGNPHAVTVVDRVDDVPMASVGSQVGGHRAFREGVNVNVVAATGPQHLDLRVWERGVGETLACGTGACATVAAMDAAGVVAADEPVVVAVRGGRLVIRRDDRGHLQMTGPSVVVATLQFDPAWLAGVPD